MAAPKLTSELIRRYIAEGRGCGHREDYLSFIQLKRWNASPVSTQTLASIPPFRRRMHFLSRSEFLLALLFAWIGCLVREQFPAWPWPGPNPLCGYHQDLPRLADSSGTLEHCRRAQIKHGFFVGTSIPYIWTFDLALTLAWLPIEMMRGALISVKPLDNEMYSGDIDPLARGPEKLEVERLYARELEQTFRVADRTLYPSALLGQLDLYRHSAMPPFNPREIRAQNWLLEQHGHMLPTVPPLEWRDRLVADANVTVDEAGRIVRRIFWHQLIDVDLSQEIVWDRVCRPGGRALILKLREELMG